MLRVESVYIRIVIYTRGNVSKSAIRFVFGFGYHDIVSKQRAIESSYRPSRRVHALTYI